MAVIGAIFLIPLIAKFAVSEPNPANKAPAIGTTMSAVKADVILVRIRINSATIIKMAVNIEVDLVYECSY